MLQPGKQHLFIDRDQREAPIATFAAAEPRRGGAIGDDAWASMHRWRGLGRRISLWVMCGIALAGASAHAALPPGLVAAYGFNEAQGSATIDVSGNALNGTVSNATRVAGRFGGALQFNGQSNSRVVVSNTPLLQMTNRFTMSAWVYPQTGSANEPTVIAKQNGSGLPYVMYSRGTGGIGPNAYVLVGGAYRDAGTPAALPLNTWSHLATTYDGAALRVFVNGVEVASAAISGNVAGGNGSLLIGNNTMFPNEAFVGRIDEVRVYNRPLTAAEIEADLNTALPDTPEPPADTTPPTGSIQINGGAASTDSTAVTLNLSATDSSSGVTQMRFSNDGVTYAGAVAFATSAAWTLTSGDGVKTVHVQFRDGAGNWSAAFTDAITLNTVPVDTTPPTGSIQINGGAASTTTPAVTLGFAATDNASGVTEMRVSNDGVNYAAAVPFTATLAWTLPGADGIKTVFVQFRDGAGNWSNAFSATITLNTQPVDTTPPSGSILIAGGAATTQQTAVTLTLAASDNLTGVAQMRFSNDGVTYSSPVAFATFAAWTLAAGNGTKTVHAQFRDGAGNWSAAFTDTIVLMSGPALTPELGAHVLLGQNEAAGTNPAVTAEINTQSSGSTLIALSMGWLRNFSQPVDTYNNTWTQLSGPNIYYNENFYTAIWAAANATGGSGHKLSFQKAEHPAGEISMALIEVKNGGAVQAIYNLANQSNQTPGTVTVDGPATLIAVWGGAAGSLDHQAFPDNGFTVIDSYLDFGNNGETGVQVAIASKQVYAAGTYTVKWNSAPLQDCACYLIVVRNPQQTLPQGLLAAYAFNDGFGLNAADSSGNGLSGSVQNATWVQGKFGSALQFSGQSNSRVTVDTSPLLNLGGSFTISAWVNPQSSQSAEPTLVAKEVPGGLPYVLYAQGSGGVGPNAYAMIGSTYHQSAAPNRLPANTWSHLAATYDGSVLSVYVDGVLASSQPVSGGLAAGVGALQIGNNTVFYNEGFAGGIDEVRVYGRALSAAEIAVDRDTPLPGGPVPIPTDTTPPTGSVLINGGVATTTVANVTLSFTVQQDESGVSEMRLSNDGVTFAAPVAYADSLPWTLSAGEGSKRVYVRFKDGAGNWSAPYSDGITLYTPQPLPEISQARPRILLVGAELQRFQNTLMTQRPAMKRFKEQVVDAQIGGGNIYGYEPWYSAFMGVVSGQPHYCAHAIQTTDQFLDGEIARINAGDPPIARRDSYLEIGEAVGGLALVYDWCHAQLTETQKLRWGNYADRFVQNVWDQENHRWGVPTAANGQSWEGESRPAGSAWSVNNPSNNYYYSFLRATMLWGLASKHEPNRALSEFFLQKFRIQKIQDQLVPVFNEQLPGGGSREGTGYGTAMRGLFDLYYLWEKSTGERIADLTPHTLDSAYYMQHAISPKRDFLAPIGDHPRDETAAFYDYHRHELLALASLNAGKPIARNLRDFLAASTRPQMGDRFNWVYDVLYDDVETTSAAVMNTDYFAPGTGHFYSRSGWNTNATWLTVLAGAYTESHAHPDPLSIMLFKNGWLVGDANQASRSGLANLEEAHGLVTQTLPNGTMLRMWNLEASPTSNPPRPESSAIVNALASTPHYAYISADEGTLFTDNNQVDRGARLEREVVFLKPDVVVVFDRANYTGGTTTKTFQLPTPGLPTIAGRTAQYGNGVSTLTVHAVQPADSVLSVKRMLDVSSDFADGYRIDSTVTTSGLAHFLNVLSTDGAATAVLGGSDAGKVTIALADGRTVLLSFHLDRPGGTIEIRNGSQVVIAEPLASTVSVPAR